MAYCKNDMIIIQNKITELFKIVTELEDTFEGRKFTMDGHLVGSIGEVIASYHYDMELLPNSFEKHDAITKDGKYVQIKTTQGKKILMTSEPDYLIVLWIDKQTGNEYEVYNGPGGIVWEACGNPCKHGGRPVSFSKLESITKKIAACDKIPSIHDIKNVYEIERVEHPQIPIKSAEKNSVYNKVSGLGKSTDIGYINKNNQINRGKLDEAGTGHGQSFYQMECLDCHMQYKANGHDIWLRKCPFCQNGRP